MGNNPSPSLAYLVVTHDGERHISNLLSSIPEGSRVIVVDNASTDATLDTVATFLTGLDLDVLRLGTNRGYASGINAGMKRIGTSADWVFVLNQDIVLNAPFEKGGWGDLPLKFEGAYRNYAIVQPRILLPNGTVNVDELHMNVWGFAYPPDYATTPKPKDPKETFFFSGAAFLLNMEWYRKTGPFDESLFLYYEEVDYAFRLSAKAGKVLFDPTWSVTHAYELSTGSMRKMRLILKNRKTIMRRYASPLHQVLSLSTLPGFDQTSGQLSRIDLLSGFYTRQITWPVRIIANLLSVPMGKMFGILVRKDGKGHR